MLKKLTLPLLVIFTLSFILIVYIYQQSIDEKPKVTVVLKDLNSEYGRIVEAGLRKGFHDFDLEGKVVAPTSESFFEQVDLLESILMENPDILIISPLYPNYSIPTLEKFIEKNIPVFLLDTDYQWENKTAYIGTDNVDLGRTAGALLGSQLQPGNEVAIIGLDLYSPVASERIKGAKLSLEAIGINIVAEKVNVYSEPSKVKAEIETILEENPKMKGIMATNDELALIAFEVITEHGLNISIIGADGLNDMIKLIEEGDLSGTVAQNPYDMGYLSIETARKVLNGENVEKHIDSGIDIIIKGNGKQRLDFQNRFLK
ncbi:sugar ABC transporter substrate-binding protein [Metabacillus litoralis]|jgi:ribose transport system substrate-binding protein|uniref:sugar ABC transporter substrate-binding protein n=1 Tax=Metabacillus litoralis TaxID=152268 RepID=UPI00203D659A|nr:sugar ABC transporter substrate-binding protein [Metabacillus litoralis]MCM3653343.1 sugar ABC transporter substrate-binding protein [Metabacillus litoralis]